MFLFRKKTIFVVIPKGTFVVIPKGTDNNPACTDEYIQICTLSSLAVVSGASVHKHISAEHIIRGCILDVYLLSFA